MDKNQTNSASFDEQQSLQVIKEMIRVSQQSMRTDGILFIAWGWISFVNYFFLNYLSGQFSVGYELTQVIRILRVALPVGGVLFTIYYLFTKRRKVITYIGRSLRYIWLSLFASLMLVNLIQYNVTGAINFELQHPIFMVFIAFAIVITGSLLKFEIVIGGGMLFGALAYVSSFLPLQEQLLVESIAWLIAFVIPGHLLYAKRDR